MKTAAIYCRVSTEDQEREGTSLQTQLEACLEKAKVLGFEAPEAYIYTEAWTGTDTDRPKLNSLRENIRQREIDALICYSTDRLARNPIHIAIIAEECQKRDIQLVFVTEPLDNSPEGQLIQYVKGYAAQMEHEKIRERTLRGKKQGVKLGKLSTGGTALFGYDQAGGKRTINEARADIVRPIFNKLAYEGYTMYRIASELNLAGISGPRGGRWSEHTIHRMVNNTAYMGETYAFRYKVIEPANPRVKRSYPKTTHIFRDKSEWIAVPDVTPAIVSREVYMLAQKQLELNRHKTPHNRKHEYLFSNGRLRCGVCGHSMVGTAKKKSKGYLRLYRCVCNMKPNYYSHCTQRSIKADDIEGWVWDEISQELETPEIILQELDEQRQAKKPVTLDVDRLLIETNIANTRDEEKRYLRQYGKGIISETELETEVKRARAYREHQEAKLAELEKQIAEYQQAVFNYEQFSDVIKLVADRLSNADHETKRLILEALNIQITLSPDRTIALNGVIPEKVCEVPQTYGFVRPRCTNGLYFTLRVK